MSKEKKSGKFGGILRNGFAVVLALVATVIVFVVINK